jgi:hypothetical protein
VREQAAEIPFFRSLLGKRGNHSHPAGEGQAEKPCFAAAFPRRTDFQAKMNKNRSF